jgi:hypothetical protein
MGVKEDGTKQPACHTGTRTAAENPQARDCRATTEAFVEIGVKVLIAGLPARML